MTPRRRTDFAVPAACVLMDGLNRGNGDPYNDEPLPEGASLEDMLEQDEWWRTRDGRLMRVEDMHPQHRRNVLAMIERNAQRLKQHAEHQLLTCPVPQGDVAGWDFDHGFDVLLRQDPAEFLAEWFPMVAKLHELIADDTGGIDR